VSLAKGYMKMEAVCTDNKFVLAKSHLPIEKRDLDRHKDPPREKKDINFHNSAFLHSSHAGSVITNEINIQIDLAHGVVTVGTLSKGNILGDCKT
jgi:hypothetical protein